MPVDWDYVKNNPRVFAAFERVTGTTADSYPATSQLVWDQAHRFKSKTIVIINTHGTNTLTFRIPVKPNANHDTEVLYPLDAAVPPAEEKDIAAGKYALIYIQEDFEQISADLKSKVSETPATFEIYVQASRGL